MKKHTYTHTTAIGIRFQESSPHQHNLLILPKHMAVMATRISRKKVNFDLNRFIQVEGMLLLSLHCYHFSLF